ncbi:MAG: aminotransferase class I/II-fold pyridoxal phosphate-dependent enzyme [Phascolarctobacterium sp.]|nr:aminotransferase class I/II-fold pyridoxal phosphate-dependent enzyme [Phascolarctobacterium sp.]
MKMPLIEAMLKYKQENIYPFHTPGHKGGRGMEEGLRSELGESVVMDVSLMSELDDIHEPETYIKEAQALAAQAYGSDACFWAVNGTSQAIHAMLMTALKPREKVLLPRNAHRSVAGGLILGGIEAVFMQPDYCEEFGINFQVQPQAVQAALEGDASIKAVLLTSPNYYGVAADVESIAKICHERKVVLLVDEAHGPHLGFSDLLPKSALQCGADACAQSTHKILGAMTQCSMLHVQGQRLSVERAADVMSLLTTTSPNYLLMASLDAARAQVQERGKEMAEAAVMAAQRLRAVCSKYAGLKLLSEADCGGLKLDVTKVTVNFAEWGYTGIEAGELLRQAGIAVELVDAQNVLFLVTYADVTGDYEEALAKIDNVLKNMEACKGHKACAPKAQSVPVTKVALPLREVFYGDKEAIALEESAGKICGEQVSFYPPGIPVLLPGEVITEEIITYCKMMKGLGLPVSGPADGSLRTIRVVKR